MATCETPIGRLPVLTSCPDDNEYLLFFNSPTSTGLSLRKWSTIKACLACSFFGPGVVDVPGSLFNAQGEYFNSALSNSLIVFYDGQPNMLRYIDQWNYITSGGNVIGIVIDPNAMPIDPAGMVYLIPNPVGCTSPQPSPPLTSLFNYSLDADDFVVPNIDPSYDGQVVTIAIKPNGFTYSWDTGFKFSDNYPEQPGATGVDTLQVYEFTYFIAANKFVCTDQSLNVDIS
jgi:hypothetical protein